MTAQKAARSASAGTLVPSFALQRGNDLVRLMYRTFAMILDALLTWVDQRLQVSAFAEHVWASLLLWAFTGLFRGPLGFVQAGAAGLIALFLDWGRPHWRVAAVTRLGLSFATCLPPFTTTRM